MANEVIVKVRVLNQSKAVLSGYPVMLMQQDAEIYAHHFTPNPTVVLASGNSDAAGVVSFVAATGGTYDIKVVTTGGQAVFNYGYIVKNSYVVDPINPQESRFSVRSGEHIQGVGAGILARTSDALGGMYSSYNFSRNAPSGNAIIVGQQTNGVSYYQDPMSGSIIMVTGGSFGKNSGNSYYHDNQSLTLSQSIDIVVGV